MADRRKKAMELFGSTSPSYLILQSLDLCKPLSGGGLSGKIAVDDWTDWTPERTAKKAGVDSHDGQRPSEADNFYGRKGLSRQRGLQKFCVRMKSNVNLPDFGCGGADGKPPKIRNGIFSSIEKALERIAAEGKNRNPHRCRKFCRSKKCGFGRQFSADGRRFPVKKRWDGFVQAPVFPAHRRFRLRQAERKSQQSCCRFFGRMA